MGPWDSLYLSFSPFSGVVLLSQASEYGHMIRLVALSTVSCLMTLSLWLYTTAVRKAKRQLLAATLTQGAPSAQTPAEKILV